MVQSRPTGHKKITLESHHRQVVDGSTPACALNNGKQGLGLNHPPPAGGGIAGNLSSLCRLGLNDPPAPAGGIWLNIICVDITGFQPTAKFKAPLTRQERSKCAKSLKVQNRIVVFAGDAQVSVHPAIPAIYTVVFATGLRILPPNSVQPPLLAYKTLASTTG